MATQYPGLEGLLGLGERADIRPTLLRVLTDLYMQKPVHSHEEERHYTELALRLLESVDESTRQMLRVRLADYDGAPQAVLDRLGVSRRADGPAARAEQHAPAIRDPLDEPTNVHDVPAETPIASASELMQTFFDAGPEERRLILLALDYSEPEEVVSGPMRDAIGISHRLESAVLRRNYEEATWQIERAFGISRVIARRIVSDPTGEPFIAAAKAIGVPTEVLQRILLFLNANIGRSVQRVYELTQLYEEISRPAAERLVALWRDADQEALEAYEALRRAAREAIQAAAPAPRGRGEARREGLAPFVQTRGYAPAPDRAARIARRER
jgi:hypothetical protein